MGQEETFLYLASMSSHLQVGATNPLHVFNVPAQQLDPHPGVLVE